MFVTLPQNSRPDGNYGCLRLLRLTFCLTSLTSVTEATVPGLKGAVKMTTNHAAETQNPVSHSAAAAPPVPATTPFANPGPLGLAAFALTTFCLSLANAGIISSASAVLGLALFYGGIAQFTAGIWEFANKNTFGATAFCSFGAFWLSFWYLLVSKSDVAAGSAGVGYFLLAWGIFTLYMTIAAIKTNLGILAVFVFLTLTFFALAINAFSGNVGIGHVGGVLGLITAVLAWYVSFADVLSSTFKRTILPVFPSRSR
jgi:uncharacterized protein